jgi:hypothetical protein
MVSDVFWLGDARPGYFGEDPRRGSALLLMRWSAVPTDQRLASASQLEAGWLERGCKWAASALVRGNAWSASEHRFLVTAENTQLTDGVLTNMAVSLDVARNNERTQLPRLARDQCRTLRLVC